VETIFKVPKIRKVHIEMYKKFYDVPNIQSVPNISDYSKTGGTFQNVPHTLVIRNFIKHFRMLRII